MLPSEEPPFLSSRVNQALLGLVVFLAVAVGGTRFVESRRVRVPIGADLSSVQLLGEYGDTVTLATGRRTTLFVYDSGCGWCAQVAPEWAGWFKSNPGTSVIAVSREPIAEAIEYARSHGWEVEVRQVLGTSESGSLPRAIVSRTPALITVGADGSLESVTLNSQSRLVRSALDSILGTEGA